MSCTGAHVQYWRFHGMGSRNRFDPPDPLENVMVNVHRSVHVDLHVRDCIPTPGAFSFSLTHLKTSSSKPTCQDKRDDVRIGLNSPALLLGYSTKPICAITGLGFFGLFAYAGWLNGQGISFYLGLLCGAIMLFSKMIKTDVDVPNDCREFFLKTKPIGQVILTGLVVDAGVMTWVKSQ